MSGAGHEKAATDSLERDPRGGHLLSNLSHHENQTNNQPHTKK